MKLYEIVVILLFITSIILQFFDLDKNALSLSLVTANSLLALSYLIGGYWLFKNKEKTNTTISILAGLAFGISIIFWWTRIMVSPNKILFYLPFVNIVFFITLLVLFFIKKNKDNFIKNNKLIFIRSFIILIFTGIFFYTPIEYSPYNDFIRAANVSRDWTQHNLNMAKYHEKAKIELDNENYEKAVEYSLLSELEGRKGFQLSDNDLFLDDGEVDTTFLKTLELERMNAIYLRLYTAYTRLAHHNLENEKAEHALKNFKTAHQFLYIYNINNGQWQQQNVVSFANMGKAFSYLNQFEEASQNFNQAISLIDSLDNIDSEKIIYAYNEIANYLSKKGFYKESNEYHLSSIDIQLQDSLNEENRENLAESYIKMGKNYAQMSKVKEAITSYQKVFYYEEDKKSNTYMVTSIYYGIANFQLYNYQKADSIFSECIKMYEELGEQEGLVNIGTCKILRSQVNIQLGKYKEAEKYLQETMEIIASTQNKNNYISCLSTYANLNSILSNYEEAEKQYQEAFELSENKYGKNSSKTVELLIQLANTKINLSKLKEAKKQANQANESIPTLKTESSYNSDNFGNELAYLNYLVGNYSFSKELYNLVIKIDKKHNVIKDLTTGIALNGLGLLEMEDKKYVKADSLFHQSLEIHTAIFKTSNPSLATLHLNMAKLYILKKEYQKAESNLAISLKINQDLFDKGHTNFADVYVAYGDLAKQQNNKEEANQHYQKALKIYLAKFDDEHFKIQFVKKQIKSVQF